MFTVASYNIHKGVGTDRLRRPERILEVLQEVDADIVALQEADRRFGTRVSALPLDMIQAESDYAPVPFDTRPDSIGWHGNAILVRRNIRILDHAVLTIPALEPRGAVLAELEVKGMAIRIVGMHLDLSGLWRRRQARAIITQLSDRAPAIPTILMGDLNEWRPHAGCLLDFAHHFHIAMTAASFHTRRPVSRLDRIIVSRDLRISGSGTHHSVKAKRASDHYPVWARIEGQA
jgi:endonuclease/exonuclease/phosphatase family metal-dependent hydrolase